MNDIIEFGVCKYLEELNEVYALHYAARYGYIENIYALKERGINVNANNDSGLNCFILCCHA
ncbi:MAG: hypothetical protein ACR5KV_04745 [Wolbachia sp.]